MSDLPVVAIVGRPNVGKSTLFNALTRGRDALVADQPGMTRDRRFGVGKVGHCPYVLIDTGGLSEDQDLIATLISRQAMTAVAQSDAVIFLTDGQEGLTALDENIVQQLRQYNLPLHLVVNKSEGRDPELIAADFHSLGFALCHTIAAVHRRGVNKLMDAVLAPFPPQVEQTAPETSPSIKVAIVGRPNVGKSTLVNRILGEERQVTSDIPGTTRDSIEIPFSRDNQAYTLIDTAGIRRRFIDFAKLHLISALHGTGVGDLFASLRLAHQAAYRQIPTSKLNELLAELVQTHNPPLVRGRRIKPRYLHQGGQNPPRFILHGTQVEALPESYQRYIINRLRETYQLYGCPIKLELRATENPYQGRRNQLTPRQIYKRKRLMKHVK